MSQQITKVKSRIKTVSSALKVTSAMKLVSTVKLKKWKNKMIANRKYAKNIDETTSLFLSFAKKYQSPLAIPNQSEKNLYIVITSSLGLCGSYNMNVFKLADSLIQENDDLIVLGGKGVTHYKDFKNNKLVGFDDYSSLADEKLVRKLIDKSIKEYLKGTYHEVHLIYSSYKNSLVFIPKDYRLLPLNKREINDNEYPPIFEPSEKELLDTLVPIYLKTMLHSKLLESEVCEQAARSNAMENATDNANELLNGLQIEFNKARQGAITQEIIEVVAASERV